MSPLQRTIDAIMEDQELMHGQILGLEGFLRLPRPEPGTQDAEMWAGELTERLHSLRALMVLRFRREEAAGPFEQLALDHPRAAGQIRHLVDEHRYLMDRLREILGSATVYAGGRTPRMRHLRRGTRGLIEALARHEEEECSLVQRLYARDLGQGASGE